MRRSLARRASSRGDEPHPRWKPDSVPANLRNIDVAAWKAAMGKAWIVLGDPTSSGGKVATGSPFTDIDGIPVARVGDRATCPKHKGTFRIVDGDATMAVDGQPVALHGSSLACGCRVLSARQTHVFLDAGGAASPASGPARASPLPGSDPKDSRYDEAFVLRSSLTGKPLAHRDYRIFHADGRCESGTTDADGTTHVVKSDCCETLRIELGEEGP